MQCTGGGRWAYIDAGPGTMTSPAALAFLGRGSQWSVRCLASSVTQDRWKEVFECSFYVCVHMHPLVAVLSKYRGSREGCLQIPRNLQDGDRTQEISRIYNVFQVLLAEAVRNWAEMSSSILHRSGIYQLKESRYPANNAIHSQQQTSRRIEFHPNI